MMPLLYTTLNQRKFIPQSLANLQDKLTLQNFIPARFSTVMRHLQTRMHIHHIQAIIQMTCTLIQ